jgi:uncharacterized protein YecE (DUF72 family)
MQANESPLRNDQSQGLASSKSSRGTGTLAGSSVRWHLRLGTCELEARVLSSGGSTKKFLEYYATQLNSVEVNDTFRQLPTGSMLADWLAASGAGFRFSFKAPQPITHILRLTDSSEAVAALSHALAPVVSAGRMGVALFQLPPNFKADLSRLESFPFARYRFRKSKYS